MTRSFWPVGQGAFYTEKFSDGSIVVYDCGSQKKAAVNNIIKAEFYDGQEIDFVFISHMHADHINGLKLLLKHCNVKKVVLPYIYKENRKFIKINSLLRQSKSKLLKSTFTDRMIDDAIGAIKSISDKTEIIFIMPEIQEDSVDLNKSTYHEITDFIDKIKDFDGVTNLRSGSSIKYNDEWIYVPYNVNYTERANLFSDKLKQKTGLEINDLSSTNFAILLQDEIFRKQIKKIYSQIPGILNTNSMVVYSGPEEVNVSGERWLYGYYRDAHIGNVGALYMGDYNTRMNYNQLKIFYQRYLDNIGLVQIPHHGAVEAFNTRVVRPWRICIISVGRKNSYGHPHQNVIRNIIFSRRQSVCCD